MGIRKFSTLPTTSDKQIPLIQNRQSLRRRAEPIITKKKMGGLNVSTVGNPNMHPWFHIPTIMGVIPGMSAAATWMMNREIEKLDFPPVPEFLEMVMDAGSCVYGCKMSMDMMKLTKDDLVEGAEVLGAMEFLELIENAQVLFV